MLLLRLLAAFLVRRWRIEASRNLLLGFAAFLALLVPAEWIGSAVVGRRVEALKHQGEIVAAWIEAYHARTGSYPESLLGIDGSPPTPPGLVYEPVDEETYSLRVFSPYGFFLRAGWRWDRETRRWEHLSD